MLATLTDLQAAEEFTEQVSGDISAFQTFLENMAGHASTLCVTLLYAIIILIAGRLLIKYVLKFTDRILARSRVEISVSRFFQSVLRVVLYSVLFIVIAGKLGIQTTSFITILGSAGVAVGLAMQGSLSNFAGGVMILLLKPFAVGDYIVDSEANEGTVERIDIFYTHLLTPDNKMVLVPNGELSGSRITNVTAMATRRVDIKVGISYGSDIDKAKVIMARIAERYEPVLKDQPIMTVVSALLESSVEVQLRVWVKKEDYWTTVFYLNETIKNTFDAEGIKIPFNQLDVHVVSKE